MKPPPCSLPRNGDICGGMPEIVGGGSLLDASLFFAHCRKCHTGTNTADTRDGALALWNERMSR